MAICSFIVFDHNFINRWPVGSGAHVTVSLANSTQHSSFVHTDRSDRTASSVWECNEKGTLRAGWWVITLRPRNSIPSSWCKYCNVFIYNLTDIWFPPLVGCSIRQTEECLECPHSVSFHWRATCHCYRPGTLLSSFKGLENMKRMYYRTVTAERAGWILTGLLRGLNNVHFHNHDAMTHRRVLFHTHMQQQRRRHPDGVNNRERHTRASTVCV